MSFVRFARTQAELHAPRIGLAAADAVLGCDVVVTAGRESLARMIEGRTRVAVNVAATPTADFTRNADWSFPLDSMQQAIAAAAGEGRVDFLDATRLATGLLGDAIAANLFMLGYAWQKGMVPVSARAIERAIELNEVSIEQNKAAFNWGRRAAVDMKSVAEVAAPPKAIPVSRRLSETLDELIARRIDFLTDYQNEAWARRFGALVERVRLAEAKLGARSTHSLHDMPLTAAVASGFFKLMSYKDEYEVARLYTQGDFLRQVHEQFEGDIRLKFHLAPPLLSRRNDKGELIKSDYGPWVLSAFKILARLKSLRGTAFDVFGYTAERRMERRLIDDYEATVNELVQLLDSQRLPLAIQIAGLPQGMRGFGHVKERNVESVMREQARLLDQYRAMTAHAPVDLAVAA